MSKLSYPFLDYLAAHQPDTQSDENGNERSSLPSLSFISKELGISVALLREQVEVAKALGLIEVRPRTGIRCLPYSFLPSVKESLSYAIATNWENFIAFSDLRNHIEESYWDEATQKLTSKEIIKLKELVNQALEKLSGKSIQIPHLEHRQLHLLIYRKLDNPFVLGLLEAFWDAYESVGFNLYADLEYLRQVWSYHQQMVDAINNKNFQKGYLVLVHHRDLLFHRPQQINEKYSKPGNDQ